MSEIAALAWAGGTSPGSRLVFVFLDVVGQPGQEESPGQRGRPRSAAVDADVLTMTVELVTEHGYADLTIKAVAARAGVSRPTVYRCRPAKDDLIAPDTGDALHDLGELAITFVTALSASRSAGSCSGCTPKAPAARNWPNRC